MLGKQLPSLFSNITAPKIHWSIFGATTVPWPEEEIYVPACISVASLNTKRAKYIEQEINMGSLEEGPCLLQEPSSD